MVGNGLHDLPVVGQQLLDVPFLLVELHQGNLNRRIEEGMNRIEDVHLQAVVAGRGDRVMEFGINFRIPTTSCRLLFHDIIQPAELGDVPCRRALCGKVGRPAFKSHAHLGQRPQQFRVTLLNQLGQGVHDTPLGQGLDEGAAALS